MRHQVGCVYSLHFGSFSLCCFIVISGENLCLSSGRSRIRGSGKSLLMKGDSSCHPITLTPQPMTGTEGFKYKQWRKCSVHTLFAEYLAELGSLSLIIPQVLISIRSAERISS